MTINNHSGVQLRIRGKVQGVGFRPYVWQLAQRLQLHGDVCNDGDGVVVRIQEDPAEFIAQLHQHCPPLARIDSVERTVRLDAAACRFLDSAKCWRHDEYANRSGCRDLSRMSD